MNEQPDISGTLIREIARYLVAVDLFRAERCYPKWLPEHVTNAAPSVCPVLPAAAGRDARFA
jgi:hypothetical protein